MSAVATAERGIPFLRLLRVELRKQVDTRAGAGLLIAIAAVSAVTIVLQLWLLDPQGLTWESLSAGASMGSSLLLPLIGIIAATSEWSQRTALQTFALEPRRTRVHLAKVLSAVAFGLVMVALTYLVGAIVNVIGAIVFDGAGSWDVEPGQVLATVLTVTISILMGVAFGLALLNTPIAIVAYLVLPTVMSVLGVIPALADVVGWIDPGGAMVPMYDWSFTPEQWGKLATSLAVWVAAPLAFGLWRTARREVA